MTFAPQNRTGRKLGVLICLALFLALQFFAASASLHKAVHADAHSPEHHCVVTLLAQGQVDAPVASSGFIVVLAVVLFYLPQLQSAVLPSFAYRLSPSRAPPRF